MRQRRLADYRSPHLRWVVLVAIAVQTTAAVMFLLVEGVWVALLMPLLGATAFAVGELLMWSAARVARMVVTDDPATARRCDNLVRAEVIARLQSWQLYCVGIAGFIGVVVADEYVKTGLSEMLFTASGLSAMYSLLCWMVIVALEERLGGTITGWWIHPISE